MPASAAPRVLIFVGDDYEDLELWYPRLRLEEAGCRVTLAATSIERVFRGKHGYPAMAEARLADLSAADFAAVVLPGGWMPDAVRRDADALRLVREFHAAGKLIATICHGPWIAISAGVVRGLHMTSTPGIRDDLANAGAVWVDQPVVCDRHFISSRRPADLPAFGAAIVIYLRDHPPA
ncbi:MAG: type 1 glutamine amidotransferase domain-containing protein [Phycisphaerae bacterium]